MQKKSRKSSTKKKVQKKEKPIKKYNVVLRPFVRFGRFVKKWYQRQSRRHQDFMKRRPQRSFRLSKRRDLKRSFKIPGYFAFMGEVCKVIWANKWLFLKFIILYAVFSAILAGLLNQESYIALRDSVIEAGEGLGLNEMVSLVGGVMTASSEESSISSYIIPAILLIFGWLIIVWMLRYRMADKKIKFRDALYNCGAPIFSTVMLIFIMVLQLIPFALALLAYTSASGIGLINWSVDIENMAAWGVLAVIAVLTLYWMATSFIALIVVTIPGTYPWTAIRIAGDKVVGRRSRILYRLLFMIVPALLMWIVVLVPVILLDNALKIEWLPLIPFASLLLSTLTLVWCASYIYMLYRYLLEDESPPVIGMKKGKKAKVRRLKKKTAARKGKK